MKHCNSVHICVLEFIRLHAHFRNKSRDIIDGTTGQRQQARDTKQPVAPYCPRQAVLGPHRPRHKARVPPRPRAPGRCGLPTGGKDWIRKFADADDHDEADANGVLTYWQAQDAAKALARGNDGTGDDKPLTVEGALNGYEKELIANEADPHNAKRVRRHLPNTLLTKPVALLNATELRNWRDGLIAKKLAPATVNRTKIGLHAALELAAESDPRITNRQAWQVGLATLPDAVNARRMILPDNDVRSLVAAAYGVDNKLGLLIETTAVTGARLSQLARLTVADLQTDRPDPRLMMPASRKGGRHKRKVSHVPVPIPVTFAAKLAQECRDRPAEAPLLLAPDGKAWRHSRHANHHALFAEAVKRAGINSATTLYHLRHSSIVRMRSTQGGLNESLLRRLIQERVMERHPQNRVLRVLRVGTSATCVRLGF